MSAPHPRKLTAEEQARVHSIVASLTLTEENIDPEDRALSEQQKLDIATGVVLIGQHVRRAVARVLDEAVATGEDARLTAKKLGRLFDPHGSDGRGLYPRLMVRLLDSMIEQAYARGQRRRAGFVEDQVAEHPDGVPLGDPATPPDRSANAEGAERRPDAVRAPGADVARAIVKRPRHDRTSWVARCANAPRGCREVLGTFEDADRENALRDDAYEEFPSDLRPTRRWVLRHPNGYGGDAEGGYRVLGAGRRDKDGLRIGRRALPTRFGDVGGALRFAGQHRGFVGQLPQAPCLIQCQCGCRNWVGEPPTE